MYTTSQANATLALRVSRPTNALPGSEAKIKILTQRASLRQPLFPPGDLCLSERHGFAGELAGGDNRFDLALLLQMADGIKTIESKQAHQGRHRTPTEKARAELHRERDRVRKREERRRKKEKACA